MAKNVRRLPDPKLKRRIMQAAEELASRGSVDELTVDEIVRHAGVERWVFDLFFANIEDLATHIVEDWMEGCSARFASPEDYLDSFNDPEAILEFCFERDVRLYQYFWRRRAVMMWLASSRKKYAHLLGPFRAEIVRRLRSWLEEWKSVDLIRSDVDVELAAAMMSGAHEELTNRLVRTESSSIQELEEWITFAQETFVRAFGTPDLVAALNRRNITGVRSIVPLRKGASGGFS